MATVNRGKGENTILVFLTWLDCTYLKCCYAAWQKAWFVCGGRSVAVFIGAVFVLSSFGDDALFGVLISRQQGGGRDRNRTAVYIFPKSSRHDFELHLHFSGETTIEQSDGREDVGKLTT